MRYIAGIDVGTSGVKCIVIDENAKVASSCTEGYPLSTPKPGWSEQNPADWWAATKKAMKQAVADSGADPKDIIGLGFSGQMHGLVALDKDNNVVRPAILWNDQRTQAECDEIIAEAGGLEKLLSYTNNHMLTGYTGSKLRWVKNNEPDVYAKMDSFLMPKDYIRFMMTGEKATEVSDASGTALFNVEKRVWNDELIDLLGFDRSIFPKCYESDEVAGYITADAAAETGLMEGMPVYAGGGDAVIQTTGMGIVSEGTVGLIIGTSGIVSMALNSFGKNEGGRLQFMCNNDKHKWQAFGCQLSSGGSLEWFKNTMYDEENPFGTINAQVEASPAGAKNLLFLPYLTGERCPYPDPDARGVFFGLSLLHDKGDMARAVMEGVVFGLRDIYELIKAANPALKPTEVVSSGGASKSKVWRQIQADIFNLPVKTQTGAAEGGAYGAAVVAGVGAGVWRDIEHAAELLEDETLTMPIPENVAVYEKLYNTYRGLYTDLKDRFKELS